MSRAYGATDCIDVTATDVVSAVADLTGGLGADVVIETSGFPASTAVVLDVVRKEGKVATSAGPTTSRRCRSSRSWPRR